MSAAIAGPTRRAGNAVVRSKNRLITFMFM
jgi:hypothetical protein